MVKRKNIFTLISFLHEKLGLWDKNIPPNIHAKIQHIYEDFVAELPKDGEFDIPKEKILKLKHSVIALVANNKDEQQELDNFYGRWISEFCLTNEDKSRKKRFKIWKVIVVTLLLSLLGMLIGNWFAKEPYVAPPEILTRTISGIPGEKITLILNLDSLIQIDSIKDINSSNYLVKNNKSQRIKLNNGIIEIDSSITKYTFTADANVQTDLVDQLTLNIKSSDKGKDTLTVQSLVIKTEITQPPTSEEIKKFSSDTFPTIAYQEYPYPNRTLKFLKEHEILTKPFIGQYKFPISILTSLLGALLLYLFKRKSIPKIVKPKNSKSGHPYFWKLELPERQALNLPETINKKVHLLRNNLPTGNKKLDINITIGNSIKKAGFTDFIYTDKTRKVDYLFLIDFQSRSDHRASLWTEMAEGLNVKDINTSTFYFNSDIRLCYNDRFPNGLNLKDLYNQYPSSVLVVVGGNYNLLNPQTGKLNGWHHIFENWESRYLITWKNYLEWDRREAEL